MALTKVIGVTGADGPEVCVIQIEIRVSILAVVKLKVIPVAEIIIEASRPMLILGVNLC